VLNIALLIRPRQQFNALVDRFHRIDVKLAFRNGADGIPPKNEVL
jgi:hypothetical protein